MKKMMRCTLAILFLLSSPYFAQDQNQPKGRINYFDGGYIEVRGMGIPSRDSSIPAQQYSTARRAAEVVAYRAIAEMIGTMQLDSETTVSKNETLRDQIYTRVSQRLNLQRVRIISETSMTDFVGNDPAKKGQVEIVMQIPLTGPSGVYNDVMPVLLPEAQKRDRTAPVYTPPAPATPPPAPAAPAPAPAPVYDGLIVRVPNTFQPAPLPRIVTDSGAIVYSPKDVRLEVLNTRGAAQYTNNEQKAREVLEDMGASSILLLRGSTLTGIDAVLRNDDAQKVYDSNKKNSFMNKARVVFLIAQ